MKVVYIFLQFNKIAIHSSSFLFILFTMSWLLTPSINANIAERLSDDRPSFHIFKYFSTGAIRHNVFKTLDRKKDTRSAAIRGDIDVVKWLFPLLDKEKDKFTLKGMFMKATDNKCSDVVKFLAENGCPMHTETANSLISGGYLEELKMVINNRLKLDDEEVYNLQLYFPDICSTAACEGYLDMLIWLREKGCNWDKYTCASAASNGHIHILKYAHENGCPWHDLTCKVAANTGNIECLKYAHLNGCPVNEETCEAAADGGHLDCLVYLHDHGCHWNEKTCARAANGGHLDCLVYLHDNGCPWDEKTCASSANIDILKYVHENGCPWNEMTCKDAVKHGRFDCLMYAHENGCPWNETVCYTAAKEGKLDMLKYAHENGCPLDEDICHIAARKGMLDILKYAHENGCPWDEDTCLFATSSGHLDCLKYAYEKGCPWDSRLFEMTYREIKRMKIKASIRSVVSNIRSVFECIQFAVENNCPHP
jgi:hypothetical protein